jgi:uncharacterized protein YaaW (UPF0174 family)
MSKKHMGSSIDDFLKEEGIFEKAQAQAVKEVVAWQLAEAMRKKKISKNKMATLLTRSLELLHVAAAHTAACRSFVSADDRQLAVAKATGFTVIDIKRRVRRLKR